MFSNCIDCVGRQKKKKKEKGNKKDNKYWDW